MEEEYTFYIEQNFMQLTRIFGFRIRNIIEAAASAAIVAYLITFIPFVIKIMILCQVVFGLSIGAFVLIGIRGRSITEFLIDFIRYKMSARKIHLRTVQHDPGRSYELDESGERLSYVEQAMKRVKKAAAKAVAKGDDK